MRCGWQPMHGEFGSLLQAAPLDTPCSIPVFFAGYTPVAPAPGAGAIESVGSVASESVLLLSNTCSEQFTFTLGSEHDMVPSCQWCQAANQHAGESSAGPPAPASHCCMTQAACFILLQAAVRPSTWAAKLNVKVQS